MLGIDTSLLSILWQISLRVLVTEAAGNSNTLQMVVATIGGPCHFRLYQQVSTNLMLLALRSLVEATQLNLNPRAKGKPTDGADLQSHFFILPATREHSSRLSRGFVFKQHGVRFQAGEFGLARMPSRYLLVGGVVRDRRIRERNDLQGSSPRIFGIRDLDNAHQP